MEVFSQFHIKHSHTLEWSLISKHCYIAENLENARSHVAKEVEAADHNQHIMAKLLEQSKYAVLFLARLLSLALSYILFCNQHA